MDKNLQNNLCVPRQAELSRLLSVFNKIKNLKIENSKQKESDRNESLNILFGFVKYFEPDLRLYSNMFKTEFGSASDNSRQESRKNLNDPNIIENVRYTIEEK